MTSPQFEQIKNFDEQTEFWYARELMPLLGYAKWETFSKVIQKAKIACQESSYSVSDHFPDAGKIVNAGVSNKPLEDYKLTRYACYLIAMNGDARKPEIALAQTYFATQTRRQELSQQAENNAKRLENRAKLTENRKKLRDEVYFRGIDDNSKFAGLEDNINLGLYTKRTKAVKKQKDIPEKAPLDDYTTNVELLAKSLSMEMTKINVNQKNLLGINPIYTEGKENAGEVRKSLVARNIKPENLPAETNIKKLKTKKYLSKQEKDLES